MKTRADAGLSVIEVTIVAAILAGSIAVIGTVLVAGIRTARFGERETSGVDQGRLAVAQIQRDVRNALAVDILTCGAPDAPVNYCLKVFGQRPDGTVDQIRYRATQPVADGPTTLVRDSGCDPGFASCTLSKELATLANRARSVPVFRCTTTTTFPQVGVRLIVCIRPEVGSGCAAPPVPSPSSDLIGVINLETAVRPRSVTASIC